MFLFTLMLWPTVSKTLGFALHTQTQRDFFIDIKLCICLLDVSVDDLLGINTLTFFERLKICPSRMRPPFMKMLELLWIYMQMRVLGGKKHPKSAGDDWDIGSLGLLGIIFLHQYPFLCLKVVNYVKQQFNVIFCFYPQSQTLFKSCIRPNDSFSSNISLYYFWGAFVFMQSSY